MAASAASACNASPARRGDMAAGAAAAMAEARGLPMADQTARAGAAAAVTTGVSPAEATQVAAQVPNPTTAHGKLAAALEGRRLKKRYKDCKKAAALAPGDKALAAAYKDAKALYRKHQSRSRDGDASRIGSLASTTKSGLAVDAAEGAKGANGLSSTSIDAKGLSSTSIDGAISFSAGGGALSLAAPLADIALKLGNSNAVVVEGSARIKGALDASGGMPSERAISGDESDGSDGRTGRVDSDSHSYSYSSGGRSRSQSAGSHSTYSLNSDASFTVEDDFLRIGGADGLMDLEEFLGAGLGTEEEFRSADADGSGELTLQEFKQWKAERVHS